MTDKETIREAFFALAESQNPSLTKDQQEKELGRCWEILFTATRANSEDEKAVDEKKNWVADTSHIGA